MTTAHESYSFQFLRWSEYGLSDYRDVEQKLPKIIEELSIGAELLDFGWLVSITAIMVWVIPSGDDDRAILALHGWESTTQKSGKSSTD